MKIFAKLFNDKKQNQRATTGKSNTSTKRMKKVSTKKKDYSSKINSGYPDLPRDDFLFGRETRRGRRKRKVSEFIVIWGCTPRENNPTRSKYE